MLTVHPLGIVFGMLMYVVSVSPSLLPRRWWWHGVVSGAMVAAGYSVGWLTTNVGALVLETLEVRITYAPDLAIWVPVLFWLLFSIWFLRAVWMSYRASEDVARRVNMKPVGPGEYLLGVVTGVGIFIVVMALVVLLSRADSAVVHWLSRWTGEPIAWLVVSAAIFYLVLLFSNRVVFRVIMAFFARESARRNDRTASGITRPQVPERSGSPGSLVTWKSVGAQGRAFLSRGPSRADIEELTGRPALEPIRAYVGLRGKDFDAQAQLLVKEMRRAGAFKRKAILVNVATGSGWVDEWTAQPFEYMMEGDCAVVSMQYSYLFSAAIFVSDKDVCRDAARALFKAVKAEVDSLENPPLLFLSGESLGAEAAQYPFADAEDMVASVDGALLVGSPCESPVLSQITEGRHRGSPEVAPVYESGRQFRVVNDPQQLDVDIYGRKFGPWEYPRIAFAQHASDPVVWYTTELAFREPDWIVEKAGLDVSPKLVYTQIVTFLQIIGDLPMAGTAPGGHGHTYWGELIPIWERLLGAGDEGVPARYPQDVPHLDREELSRRIRTNIEDSGRGDR